MPLFDFQCRDCGAVSELLVRGPDDRDVKCEACDSGDVERQLPTFAVRSGGGSREAGDCAPSG